MATTDEQAPVVRRVPRPLASTLAAGVLALSMIAVSVVPAASAGTAGTRLWAKRHGLATFQSVVVSPDGTRVFATGQLDGDYLTVARDPATGTELWARRYDGPDDLVGQASDVAVSPDGTKVFVTGAVEATPSGTDYGTVAYDASTGERLWAKLYDGAANTDFAYSIAASADGTRVYVTGGSANGGAFGCATVAYRAVSGAELWAKRYESCTAYDIGASPSGTTVFVTGQFSDTLPGGGFVNGFITIAYAASTGARLWVQRYNGASTVGDDIAYALAVSPDGTRVFVTGSTTTDPSIGSAEAATIAYNASTGARLWAKRHNGPTGRDDGARAIAVDPAGRKVFVTGASHDASTGTSDYLTVAYRASTGAELWAKLYDGPAGGNDNAWSIAVSPDGTKVFVTGASDRSNIGGIGAEDYLTIEYEVATGTRLWTRRFDNPDGGQDIAWSVAASPDGTKVFVAGTSPSGGATIAYAA